MMSQNEGGYPVDYSTITNLFLQFLSTTVTKEKFQSSNISRMIHP
ncbi:hypothetical protein AALP_AA6G325700 [Arabis alpina]|uniref:Uncharacterized protein n=1 Tax=Arabis alpina TaxID=50452 RepID=A0A087GT65_ARAAL|nr:hypothetical protein AALP_AA6G325700 [Arabis alpina]